MPEANRDDIRELILQTHRILYLIESDFIKIITIVHAKRNLDNFNPELWDIN